jgi:GTPase SAR1 family protein
MTNHVFYDIETYPDAVNGIKLTVAVTYDELNNFLVWEEHDALELVDFLLSFEYIVGFSIKHLDNKVLAAYSGEEKKIALDSKSIDLVEIIEEELSHRVDLNSVSKETINRTKTGDGEQAMQFWAEGKLDELLKYCRADVEIVVDLFYFVQENGHCFYNKMGERKQVYMDLRTKNERLNNPLEKEASIDLTNPAFVEVIELIRNTRRNIFVTGKAGVGKTTLLKYIRQRIRRKTVVLAPTGIAALNADGSTIHSFFKINPHQTFFPGDPSLRRETTNGVNIYNTFKYTDDRIETIQNIELLIFDEVSMIRADMLDLIDTLLRVFRKSNEPFGGVQTVFFGDLLQLPPVVGTAEKTQLKKQYTTSFFFGAKCFESLNIETVELDKVYRQGQDEMRFIQILNNFRIGVKRVADLNDINRRYQSLGDPIDNHPDHVTLCSTNEQVDRINETKLKQLVTLLETLKGSVVDNFPEDMRLTELDLNLKVGAKVMFLVNSKDYYNGKMGIYRGQNQSSLSIETSAGYIVHLEKYKWENKTYKYNREKDEMEITILGTFTQFPIRLAYAITVHKSQGLSLDQVIASFNKDTSPGMVYVGLSRCTKLEGLVLRSRIPNEYVKADKTALAFYERLRVENNQKEETVQPAREELIYNVPLENAEEIMLDPFIESIVRQDQKIQDTINFLRGASQEDVERYVKVLFEKYQLYQRQLEGKKITAKSLVEVG